MRSIAECFFSPPNEEYAVKNVCSKDGTSIAFRHYGHGPGVVLVQGAMGTAENFSVLAEVLAKQYSVFVLDRRGRGMSPADFGPTDGVAREIEDLNAVLMETGSRRLFALSSGAIVALTAASRGSRIDRLAVFEPPLFTGRPLPVREIELYERAMKVGDVALALVAAGRGIGLNPFFKYIPIWLLRRITARMIDAEDAHPPSGHPTMRELAPSLRFDFWVLREMHGRTSEWRSITQELLLLGGAKSPKYLRDDMDALAALLPKPTRLVLKGLDHGASWYPVA